nr:hypothetical protein CFP56_13458 [Quercus suber]
MAGLSGTVCDRLAGRAPVRVCVGGRVGPDTGNGPAMGHTYPVALCLILLHLAKRATSHPDIEWVLELRAAPRKRKGIEPGPLGKRCQSCRCGAIIRHCLQYLAKSLTPYSFLALRQHHLPLSRAGSIVRYAHQWQDPSASSPADGRCRRHGRFPLFVKC